ncbi:MAG: hypothetical protein RBR35_10595 [Salinivirgaceae bacterium]|nr:hypothetical protein [Salinivirgaceae bacterium]MDY0280995.1 hypothetical protein [Salinivirgaceae bacterium]
MNIRIDERSAYILVEDQVEIRIRRKNTGKTTGKSKEIVILPILSAFSNKSGIRSFYLLNNG